MSLAVLLYAGGIYHIGWAVFDMFWPRFFNWKVTLSQLDDFNKAVLHISGRLLVVLYVYLAAVTFSFGPALLEQDLGRTLILFIVVYWAYRAVMQIQFFGFAKADTLNVTIRDGNFPWPMNAMTNRALSTMMFVVMILGVLLHLLPLLFG